MVGEACSAVCSVISSETSYILHISAESFWKPSIFVMSLVDYREHLDISNSCPWHYRDSRCEISDSHRKAHDIHDYLHRVNRIKLDQIQQQYSFFVHLIMITHYFRHVMYRKPQPAVTDYYKTICPANFITHGCCEVVLASLRIMNADQKIPWRTAKSVNPGSIRYYSI